VNTTDMVSAGPAGDPDHGLLERVWRWFVYDAVETEALCDCLCHIGAARPCAPCACQLCHACWRRIKAAMIMEHRQQCQAERVGSVLEIKRHIIPS